MASLKHLTEQELITAFCNNQASALSELVNRSKNKLYTSIYFIVKEETLAEDIMQDTYIKAIKKIKEGSYTNDGKFTAWLVRIAHNLCMDFYRKTKKMPLITLPDGRDIFEVLDFENETENRSLSEKKGTSKRIEKLLNQIPQEQREVIVLRIYANLSFKKIADITNTNLNTALGRMRYGLKSIRKIVTDNQLVL